jgi:hypothetical protein
MLRIQREMVVAIPHDFGVGEIFVILEYIRRPFGRIGRIVVKQKHYPLLGGEFGYVF